MKRFLFATAIALAVFLAPAPSRATAVDVIKSVRPLQVASEGYISNMCSTSSIGDRMWLTAAHCVADQTTKHYIMGELVTIYGYDEPNDIAFLTTATLSAPPLKLAAAAPVAGDYAATAGYPASVPFPIFSVGQIANAYAVWPGTRPYTIIQVVGAPGSSGSPVVNAAGEIISMLLIAPEQRHVPILGGSTWEQLNQYRHLFGG